MFYSISRKYFTLSKCINKTAETKQKQRQSTRGMDQVLWPSAIKKLVNDVEMWPSAEVPLCTIPNFHRLIFSSLYFKEQQGVNFY